MNTADSVKEIIGKCDLYIEDSLFSKEQLMRRASEPSYRKLQSKMSIKG